MPQETAYFCPDCGSSSVEKPVLIGGSASCKSCEWKGPSSDLLAHKFEHDMGSPDAMTNRLVSEVTNVLVKLMVTPLGRVLVRWGFLDPKHKYASAHLRQFMLEAGKAMMISFVETRDKIVSGYYERAVKVDPHCPQLVDLPESTDVPVEKTSGN